MNSADWALAGKSVIVTGAASGIGRAAALAYAAAGAQVLACDLAEGVEEVAAQIRAAGGAARAMRMDAGAEGDVIGAVDAACADHGGLDVIFANAGITGGVRGLFDQTAQTWAEVLRVNLVGPFLAIRHGAPRIEARGGGAIVLTASVAGLRANAGPACYSASKAGVINLAQTAAQELAGTGVRVNAICPGLIETGMTRPIYDYARAVGAEGRLGSLNPLRRGGAPEEIAATALFLSSPLSSYINGQAIAVDGGLSASHPHGPRASAEEMQAAIAAAARGAEAEAGAEAGAQAQAQEAD
ncbi:SDR family NAD(P)-dependent oxidoreductase [Rhodovulum sp. DZ06]|uniref:SDR family NAD(P)-dependent oxidoreductase n=1 Tax=Rhodovulum sp. DZ06 TaxID=3425126 RepID=UPI003D3352A2